jgi:hypothetical protein
MSSMLQELERLEVDPFVNNQLNSLILAIRGQAAAFVDDARAMEGKVAKYKKNLGLTSSKSSTMGQ